MRWDGERGLSRRERARPKAGDSFRNKFRHAGADGLFQFGGPGFGVGDWQSFGHARPLMPSLVQIGIAEDALTLTDEFAQLRKLGIRRQVR